jgi:hypothetical protein
MAIFLALVARTNVDPAGRSSVAQCKWVAIGIACGIAKRVVARYLA